MIRTLDYSITVGGVEQPIISAEFNDNFKTQISKASFVTTAADQSWFGDKVHLALGYDGSVTQLFTGYVDEISYTRLPGTYQVTCSNVLKLAQNHYIIGNSPDEPWTRQNIQAETLIGDLLRDAGISNYVGSASSFTFGTRWPVEFNLISSLDAINQLCNIIAYTVYVVDETVYFARVWPTPGTPSLTIDRVVSATLVENTRDLRNKVVVFGAPGIRSETSVESPYLPAGFYQTAIVSSELIDTQTMADQSASYNLTLYNKLNREMKITIEGDPDIKVRDTIHLTLSSLNMDEDWFVYGVNHSFAETYTTDLILRA